MAALLSSTLLTSVLVALPTSTAMAALVPAAGPVIIDNGVIQLGINPTAELNVGGGTPSSGGTSYVGLRYLPTNAESTAPGCLCEGWGAADAISGSTGYANQAAGTANLEVISFDVDDLQTQAISVVHVLDRDGSAALEVTHDYHPSPITENLYEVSVTIRNLTLEIVDPRYRRVMDWDIEPTAFSEYSTIDGSLSANLLYSSNDGFTSSDPLGGPSDLGETGFFIDAGPDDHGALFDFGFDPLGANESVSFTIFYGATGPTSDPALNAEENAIEAVSRVGAEVWSFGQPSSSEPTVGDPNTFIFAFSGVGGLPSAGGDARPPVLMSVFGTRMSTADTEDFLVRLRNIGDGDALDGELVVTTDLPVTGGSDPRTIGTIAGRTEASSTFQLDLPESSCADQVFPTTFTFTYSDGIESVQRQASFDIVVPGSCGTIEGRVSDFDSGLPIVAASVTACPAGPRTTLTGCLTVSSGEGGLYALVDLADGTWDLQAFPPADDTDTLPVSFPGIELTASGRTIDLLLGGPSGPPPGTSITPATSWSSGPYPTVYWHDELQLRHEGCPVAAVTYQIRQGRIDPDTGRPVDLVRSGEMPEGEPGIYVATIDALYPLHGYTKIYIDVDCPDPTPDAVLGFDIYIDPSGTVVDDLGRPVDGATVTLYRSDDAAGPFTIVPDGSTIMSPANRTNPDITGADGFFQWDTLAGYYEVRATKTGCTSGTTGVLPVPPPQLDLVIRIDCGGSAGGSSPADGPLRTRDEADATVAQGNSLSTLDDDGQAIASNPIVTTVKVPATGRVTIGETAKGSAPDGWKALPVLAKITSPTSPGSPIVLTFRIDGSLLPAGESAATVAVFRNGIALPRCGDAAPPCIRSASMEGDDAVLVVETPEASDWTFGTPAFSSIAALCSSSYESRFRDVDASNTHGTAINCLTAKEIIRGKSADRFDPHGTLTRGQVASLVVRTLAVGGRPLPAGPDAFTDDNGSTHEDAINRLAAAGLIKGVAHGRFEPASSMTRGQSASLLAKAYTFTTGRTPVGPDAFSDDNGSVHEAATNALAQMGIVVGRSAEVFGGGDKLTRAQSASLIGRFASRLVAERQLLID